METSDASLFELREAAGRLVGSNDFRLSSTASGANSHIFRMETSGKVLALKVYPQRVGDTRDRLDVEWRSLHFLTGNGVGQVPAPIARDDARRIMILEWLEGPLVAKHTAADLDDAIDFMVRIFAASKAADAAGFPLASEACLSAAEIVRQLDDRLSRFAPHPALARFLDAAFVPGFAAAKQGVAAELAAKADLPPSHRRLIPADFGFHNAIRTASGLRYIDFDYFGWDDPVKLIADFLLHPAMSLTKREQALVRTRLLAALPEDTDAEARLARHLPLYALRWALIVLNPFRADRQASLSHDAAAVARHLEGQVDKAARFVEHARSR